VVDEMRRGVRHPARCTRRAQTAALAAERDDDLLVACRAAHAREAMGQHAAPQVFGELALNMTGQSATFGIGCAHLGEHRLPVPRDEFVQHRVLGFAASVAGERLSGRAGRSFVQAAREHLPAS